MNTKDLYKKLKDDKVDRAYHRELKLNSIASKQPPEDKTLQAVEEISRNVVTVKTPNMPSVITGSLAVLIQSYPDDLKFEPENEHEPVFLNRLPEELLVFVISKLDPTSIERFARLSKKARVLTLDSGIWRSVCLSLCLSGWRQNQTFLPVLSVQGARCCYLQTSSNPRSRRDGSYNRTLPFRLQTHIRRTA